MFSLLPLPSSDISLTIKSLVCSVVSVLVVRQFSSKFFEKLPVNTRRKGLCILCARAQRVLRQYSWQTHHRLADSCVTMETQHQFME